MLFAVVEDTHVITVSHKLCIASVDISQDQHSLDQIIFIDSRQRQYASVATGDQQVLLTQLDLGQTPLSHCIESVWRQSCPIKRVKVTALV